MLAILKKEMTKTSNKFNNYIGACVQDLSSFKKENTVYLKSFLESWCALLRNNDNEQNTQIKYIDEFAVSIT